MSNPKSPYKVTPLWLTNVLRERHIIADSSVASIEVEPIDDKGLTSTLARLKLTYSGRGRDDPSSMVIKFSTPDPELRANMGNLRTYEREVRFYEEIADTIDLRTPRCYYSMFDPDTIEHILILEDLAPARIGSTIAGCSRDEAEIMIRSMAKFHATWWMHPQLDEKSWLSHPELHQWQSDWYKDHWHLYLNKVGDILPAAMRTIGEKLLNEFLNVGESLYSSPETIIHGDFQLDNLMFDVTGEIGTIGVIDWQFVTRGRGSFDVGSLLGYNIESDARKAHERELMRIYHQVLVENDVYGYSLEQAWDDYRRTLLYMFARQALVIGMGIVDDQLEAVRAAWVQRMVVAILDNDCGELL
jgi:thiamine kinase-like enzyme